jgi:histone H1/5
MKRQARPFVIETKRSRKAPTNLWASTPLLQQELAAVSAPEQRADAFFTDRSKERAAEPARRILQSLIVEEPSPVVAALEMEEAADAVAPRRRTRSDGDVETAAEPARRGRPRRIVAPAEAAVSGTASPKATGQGEARPRKLAAPKLAAPKLAAPKLAAPKLAAPKLAAPKLAAPKPPKAKPAAAVPATAKASAPRVAAEPAALKPRLVAASDLDSSAGSRVTRARAPRNSAAAALLPGERWKRRLPQRLW